MTKTFFISLICCALCLSCSSPSSNAEADDLEENASTETNSDNQTSNSETEKMSEETNEKQDEGNSEPWITVEGTKIRKNTAMQKRLGGKMYVLFENYNSGGGSGGYNSERRMTLCKSGEVTTYENSQTSIYAEGADASSASEDSDTGTWEVYEDAAGNTFLKVIMKKSGEGFINFALKDGKLIMGGKSYSITKGDC